MNKDQVKKLAAFRVRIRPIALRPNNNRELPPVDDDWTVSELTAEKITLTNLRTGHCATLGLDHIHSFLSDPARDQSGIKYGFLQLRVQLSLLPHTLNIEPLPPGDWGANKSGSTGHSVSGDRMIDAWRQLENSFGAARPFAFCWSCVTSTGELSQWWVAARDSSHRQECEFRILEAGALLKESEMFSAKYPEINNEPDGGWRWCVAVMNLVEFHSILCRSQVAPTMCRGHS